MRTSPAELVAHHEPEMAVEGTRVVVTFRDQGPARAFRDGLVAESTEIPRGATRLVRTISVQEGPEPGRAVLELVDGDMRAHRFFVDVRDLKTLSTIPLVVATRGVGTQTQPPERMRAEQLDDLIKRGNLERRLFDVENSIRIQRRRINTIMATYVERAHLPTGRFPSYCCQCCGDQIGWIGRFFQAVGLRLHTCRIRRADEADLATAEAVRTRVEAA